LLLSAAAGIPALAAAATYARRQRRLRLGLVGCGARGRQLASAIRWTRVLPVYGEVTAVCDVDAERAAELQAASCPSADVYGDHRKLLERDDLDAVVIATPDHWHAAQSIDALQAGKAVYCEKPLTLTVAEGQHLVRAAEVAGLPFQVGTIQRSDRRFQTACELVRNGRLGAIHHVDVRLPTGSLPPTSFGGPFENESPPPHLDWDRWLGQAPAVEFCKQRFDPFRWWFEYGGGFLTDWGAHHFDIVHWALGFERSGPTTVDARGTLPAIENGYNTPRDFTVDFTYPGNVTMHVELSAKINGVRFIGERGTLFVDRHRIEGSAYDELAAQPLPADAVRFGRRNVWGTPTFRHLDDFFQSVDTGTTPLSDVVSQHRTATACHLANISLRIGRKIAWDAGRETIVDDPAAASLLARRRRAGYELVA
jgi:predicted dehydrogenase